MNEIVRFQAPRLPFHPIVEERFGVDKTSWKALTEAVFPNAESVDSIVMALAYCKARNLDIFKRPVQIVPIYDKKRGKMVETVWPGISELRTTAMRTGNYAGKDKTDFGPMVTTTLSGVEVTFPEWAQITLHRVVPGAGVCRFEGPAVYWLETYATAKRDSLAPNAMWKKRPRGQLEKCAEAAALRSAFPEELGNEYAAEEVEGQVFQRNQELPAPSGMAARLEASGSGGEGFHPGNVEAALCDPETEAEFEPVASPPEGDVAGQLEGEESATAGPPTDTAPVTNGTSGADPDQQDASQPDPGPQLKTGKDLLLADLKARATKLGEELTAAETPDALSDLWAGDAQLRADLAEHHPKWLAQVEKVLNDRMEALT